MLAPGTILAGRYRICHPLGQGGMALVYAAEHVLLPIQYAIKVINAQLLGQDPSFLLRFEREARILAALKHPHMVQVQDYACTEDGQPYLVMERLFGQDLHERQASGPPLSVEAALQIVVQAAAALDAAHSAGIIHRDLKPSNLFLSRLPTSDFVKVLDFGIAKVLQEDSSLPDATAQSSLLGTPAYMSPEQAENPRRVDARSDQFSLAVIAWELLARQRAFHRPGVSHYAILKSVTEDELPPVFSARMAGAQDDPPIGDRERRIEQALQRALAKQPERRFSSVLEFASALQGGSVAAVGVSFRGEIPPTQQTSRPLPLPITQAASRISGDAHGEAQGRDVPMPQRSFRTAAWLWTSGLVMLVAAGEAVLTRFFRAPPQPTTELSSPVSEPMRKPVPAAAPPSPVTVKMTDLEEQRQPPPSTPSAVVESPLPKPRRSSSTVASASGAQRRLLHRGSMTFAGGSAQQQQAIERCLLQRIRDLQDEGTHGEDSLLGRWLQFGGSGDLRLRPPPSLPNRPAVSLALRESINECLHRAAELEDEPAAAGSMQMIAACVSNPRLRCPKEPPA